MCINPAELPNGQKFGCRKCWQCRENSIQDWVGRCIAQSKTSSHTYSTTITYGGGDHERATVLTYSDVQKYFKRLRKAGFKFKYLCAGEYGSTKGRAHWHLILFFDGPAPKHELRKNFDDPFWPHGFSYWDEPTPAALRYVCKYIKKDEADDEAHGKFMMSKKPPIGSEYFARMARSYAENGLSPQDLRYSFAENRDPKGNPVKHMLQGATARDFLQRFIEAWQEIHGNDRFPNSELVEAHVDKLARYAPDPVMDAPRYGEKPSWLPRSACTLGFSEPHNSYITHIDGQIWFWRPLDPEDTKGEHAWQNGKTAIRWEQSDKYRDLRKQSEDRKRDRDEARARTLQAAGATASASHRSSRPDRLARRLPMVGDGWL